MRVLGVHDGHNASACLCEDGVITHAVQEERLQRTKNWFGMPEAAIMQIIEAAGCSVEDVDRVALSSHHMPRPRTRDDLLREYSNSGTRKTRVRRLLRHTFLHGLYRNRRKRERIGQLQRLGFAADSIVCLDHHLTHAAAAYHGLGNYDEDVLVLTNDGAGDGLCATVNIGRAGRIERLSQVREGDSIGNVYAAITFLLGMVPLEHEYKLMGMAPYAKGDQTELVYCQFMDLFELTDTVWRRRRGCPETYYSYPFFKEMLELKRFDAICGGLQRFVEEVLTSWVRKCVEATGIHTVALSGGVFMNVKANKAILELPEVESLYVFPSCGDETNAIGAAYKVYADAAGIDNLPPFRDLYLGASFTDASIERALDKSDGFRWEQPDDIEQIVATLLSQGKVVARFKGRAEFGARALGNRSILADPGREDVVKEINELVKSRDFWMPFAPSMLPASAERHLVNPKSVSCPYMILALDTKNVGTSWRAASHPYDGTVRPQVVYEAWNPDYYRLIEYFDGSTGRGCVLNTSFNLHGFPIVETPEDAIDVLRRSGLRYLALGSFLVVKD